ncbi:MAG: hypothetical protein WAT39_03185 [Planctomycetota bacterium]
MGLSRIAFALLASTLAAQTTHFVGGTGFAQIRDALAIAAPEDVILVQPGTYAQFDVLVGVTIRAVVPGSVTIAYNPAFAPPGCATTPGCPATQGPTRFSILTGQQAHVVGLRFDSNPVIPFGAPRVEVVGDRVTFDQCEFRGAPQALRIDQAAVHLQDCAVIGTAVVPFATHALHAVDAVVTVVGGSFIGLPGIFALSGGDGIRLDDCVFQGSGFQATGGPAFGTGFHGLAIRATGGATWISDATLQNGGSCGLAPSLQSARITWATPGCPPGNGSVLGVLRPSPLQIGTTFTLDFRTSPNGFAAVFANTQLAWNSIGLTSPEPYLALPNVLSAGLFVAGPTGVALASWPIPNNASLVGQACWFQGVTGLSLPFLTSPVAGGIIR